MAIQATTADYNDSDGAGDPGLADLAAYAETRDPELEARLLEEYRPLARALARRFIGRGEPVDDLVQVAMFALLKALRAFDPGFGVRFASFAAPTIIGELKRHFRDHAWAVRTPRWLQELHLEVQRQTEDLTHELGRSPRIDELAARCGVSDERILESMELGRARVVASLDRPLPGGDTIDVRPELAAIEPGYAGVEGRAWLDTVLGQITPGDVELLRVRFEEGLTQTEIAARLGKNQMFVSRRLTRSLARLRALAEGAA